MKKRVSAFIICIAFFSVFFINVFAADIKYIVNNPLGAPLYYLASDTSNKTAHIPYNTVLTPLGSSGKFIQVRYDGYLGYVDISELSYYDLTVGVSDIIISSYPDKTVYYEDDVFDSYGLRVSAVMQDGSLKEINGFNITVPDMHTVGVKTVAVNYNGKKAYFNIDVIRLPLSSIEITKAPLSYTVTEGTEEPRFDGMQITAYFTDGREPLVTDKYGIYGYDPEKLGEQVISVYYKYTDIKTDITVNVVPKSVVELRVEKLPEKTVYYDDDLTPDSYGISVRAYYDNGKSEIITPEKIEFTDFIFSGSENDMIVYYNGCTASFKVRVERTEISGVRVISPVKTVYMINEQPNLDGLAVFIQYNSGREESTLDYSIDGIDTSFYGEKIVNVYYDNFSTSFKVTVGSDAKKGDIDKDGKINSRDARIALRGALRLENLTDEQIYLGDVNKDNKITTTDSRMILRYTLKLEYFDE